MKVLRLIGAVAGLFMGLATANAQTALQNYQPGFRLIDGSKLNLMVAAVNNMQGTGTPAALTGSSLTITGAGASALTVGRLGATNPVLKIDASTALVATGLQVKGAAAASGVSVVAISSGTDENLTVDAKGAGTLTLNGTATGNIVLGAAATGVSLSTTGALTAKSGTAVPNSAGAVAAGAPISLFSGGNKIWITSDVPSFSATKGDLCINTGGSSSSTRLYINNGTTSWIAITTAS